MAAERWPLPPLESPVAGNICGMGSLRCSLTWDSVSSWRSMHAWLGSPTSTLLVLGASTPVATTWWRSAPALRHVLCSIGSTY